MKRAITLLAALISTTAMAEITIVGGGAGGAYNKEAEDISSLCNDTVPIRVLQSTGCDANLDMLLQKKADMAMCQTDTLAFGSMNDPRLGENEIRVFMVMHPEEVHIIVKSDLKVGGTLGIGGHAPQTVEDLKGLKVGAWGGSYTTARTINAQTKIGFEVEQLDNEKAALPALNTNKVQAIIRTAGQTDSFVDNLPRGQYRLLPMSAGAISVSTFYVPTKLNYPKMDARGLPSVASQALLLTRNFHTDVKRKELSMLKSCIISNMGELQEGTGHAPQWSEVDPKATSSVRASYETTPIVDTPVAVPNKAPIRKK